MNGFIYFRQVQADQLPDVLALTEGIWCYVESELWVDLIYANELTIADLETIRHGRLFGETHEIRWTRTPTGFSVQILTEQEPDTPFPGFVLTPFDVSEPFVIYLWGTHYHYLDERHFLRDVEPGKNLWVETRIPRPLYYPVEGDQPRVIIRARHYTQNGLVRTTRWLTMETRYDA